MTMESSKDTYQGDHTSDCCSRSLHMTVFGEMSIYGDSSIYLNSNQCRENVSILWIYGSQLSWERWVNKYLTEGLTKPNGNRCHSKESDVPKSGPKDSTNRCTEVWTKSLYQPRVAKHRNTNTTRVPLSPPEFI